MAFPHGRDGYRTNREQRRQGFGFSRSKTRPVADSRELSVRTACSNRGQWYVNPMKRTLPQLWRHRPYCIDSKPCVRNVPGRLLRISNQSTGTLTRPPDSPGMLRGAFPPLALRWSRQKIVTPTSGSPSLPPSRGSQSASVHNRHRGAGSARQWHTRGRLERQWDCQIVMSTEVFQCWSCRLHFPRKPIGEQAPADEISPPHLRGRKLSQPGSVR